MFEKIESITSLPEQHVYDLSIEGTRNFIANDIIAHNTARYFQYKVAFNTTDARFTPLLNNVSINYTLRSNLSILDDTERRIVIANELFNFTANFTDGLDPINGTGINCTLSHNASGSFNAPIKMDYDPALKIYWLNRSFSNRTLASFNITCDGTILGYNIIQTIDVFNVSIARYSLFNGSTTDLNGLSEYSNASDIILEVLPYGKIEWKNRVNLTAAELNKEVNISRNLVGTHAQALHRTLNSSANITIYNMKLVTPVILKNNKTCSIDECKLISYNGTAIVFNVTSFSNFSAQNGTANLTLSLNVSTALGGQPVAVSGHVNLSNGSNLTDHLVRVFLDNVEQYNRLNVTDTSDTDFNKGNLSVLGNFNTSRIVGTGLGANLTINISLAANQTQNLVGRGISVNASTVLYLRFEEGTGQYANDSGIYGNNGTLAGNNAATSDDPVWNSSAKFGSFALSFDGVNDYVNLSNSSTLNAPGNFTVEAWVYITSDTASNWVNFISKRSLNVVNYQLQQSQDITKFSLWINDGNGFVQVNSTTSYSLNRWFHVAGVRNTAEDVIKIFVNGREEASIPDTTTGSIITTEKFSIGHEQFNNAFFSGTIDEVRLWNISLTNETILSHYQKGWGYFNTSNFTSRIFDFGGVTNWTSISWNIPTNYQYDLGEVINASTVLYMKFNNDTLESERQLNVTHNISAETNLVLYMPFDSANAQELKENGSTVLLMHFNNDTGTGENASLFLSNATFGNGTGIGNGSCVLASALCPNYTTGKLGKGFVFDGVDDIVNVSDKSNLTILGDISIESWIKTSATAIGVIISKGSDGPSPSGTGVYTFRVTAAGKLQYLILGDGTAGVAGSGLVNDGNWNHVAVTFSPSTDVLRFYINGALDADTTYTSNPRTGSNNTIIGARDQSTAGDNSNLLQFFNGTIDELAIYNISLSSEIIAKHSGYGIDKSIYGNNATLMNGTNVTPSGKFQEAMQFDGGDFFVLPNLSVKGNAPRSAEAWIKIASVSNRQMIFAYGENGEAYKAFEFEAGTPYLGGSNNIGFHRNDGVFSTTTGALQQNEWAHVAITYAGTTTPAGLKFYINGVSQGFTQTAGTTGEQTLNTNDFRYQIGSRVASGVRELFFNGTIEDFAFWNITLTADKIAEHAGAKILDYSVYGNNGTRNFNSTSDNGRNYTAGKFSKALVFDGVNDYVNVSDPSSGILDFGTNNFSVSYWVRATGTNQWFVTKRPSSTAAGWGTEVSSTGTARFAYSDGTTQVTLNGQKDLRNEWHHNIFTIDKATNSLNIYVDGVKEATTSIASVTGSVSNTNNFIIARADDATSNLYTGTIDELSIWNITLTSEDIRKHYERGVLKLNISTRASNDTTTWSNWQSHSNKTVSTLNQYARYIQYKADFNTTDPKVTPILNDITLNFTGILTNYLGDYNYTLSTSTYGARTVRVNTTFEDDLGDEESATLSIISIPDINRNFTVPTYPMFNRNVTIVVNATDNNSNIIAVNITLIAPNGTRINLTNGTRVGDLHNSSFNLTSYGTWRWNVTVFDSDGFIVNMTTSGEIILMEISENLNVTVVSGGAPIAVSGHINLSNGSNVSNNKINIFLNGDIQNLTGNFTDTSDTDFNKGNISLNTSVQGTGSLANVTIFTNLSQFKNDSYTVLLLHFNGTHESTSFYDDGNGTKTVVRNGTPIIVTNVTKINGSAAFFDGDDNLTIADSDDWFFGTGDFTIEMWAYFESFTTYNYLIFQGPNVNDDYIGVFVHSTTGLTFSADNPGIGGLDINVEQGSFDWQTKRWYHIAAVRSGNEFSLYRDGVIVNRTTDTSSVHNTAAQVQISGNPGGHTLKGYLDELRVSKGIARYTGNFTPHTFYLKNGNFTSQVFDAGQTVNWTYINWTNTTPINTNLSMYYRTSSDNITFSSWNQVSNGTYSLISLNSLARYFQYLASFNSSNYSLTPILSDVTVNYTGIFTDSFGNYNYTLTASSTAATYVVKVNSTYSGTIPGESLQSFRVIEAPVLNRNYTVPTYPTFGRNVTIIANVTDADNTVYAVNFTLIAPNGTKFNATNGSSSNDFKNATFNLTNYGTWRWNVTVFDSDGFITNSSSAGEIILLQVVENLNLTIAVTGAPIAVSGHINLSNSSNVSDNAINIFLSETLMGINNLTPFGTYKQKQFIDTNSSDFNAGTGLNVSAYGVDGTANLTLNRNTSINYPNSTGNFTSRMFNASTIVNWSYISWNDFANNKYGNDLSDSVNASTVLYMKFDNATGESERPLNETYNISNEKNLLLYMKFNNDTLESERQLNVTHNISAETNLVLYMPFDSANAQELRQNGSTVLLMHFNNDTGTGENASLFLSNATFGNGTGIGNGSCRLEHDNCPIFNQSNPKLGKAGIELNGSTLVNVSDTSALSFANEIFSLEAWIKTSKRYGDSGYIIAKGDNNNFEYEVSIDSNQRLDARIFPLSGASQDNIDGVTVVNDGNWHHVAVTAGASILRVYLNGILEGSTAITRDMGDGTTPLLIGTRGDKNGPDKGFFNGTIDEVAAWNVTLGSEIIAKHAGYGIDKSIYGNNASFMNGTNVTAGKFQEAMEFDGTQGYVYISDQSRPVFTAEMWIRILGGLGSTNKQRLIMSDTSNGWGWYIQSANKPILGKLGVNESPSADTAITDSAWHHIAVAYDGSTVRYYLDGNKDGTPAYAAAFTSVLYRIGHGGYNFGGFFNGTIDEVAIWNITLTPDKIAEHAGAKVLDYSNYKNNGTRNFTSQSDFGRNYTAGKFGKALVFDGVNDFVSLGTSGLPAGDGPGSDFAWIKTTSTSSQVITFHGKSTDTTTNWRDFTLNFQAKQIYFAGNSADCGINGPVNVTDGNWHHIGYTYAGSKALIIYVDGLGTACTLSANLNTINDVSQIGIAVVGTQQSGGYFNGTIDEVSIWNVTLTPDKIAEMAGSKVLDYSQYGNNGTRGNFSGNDFGRNYTAGKFGKGLLFDGQHNWVNVTNATSFSFGAKDFTMEAWVYPLAVQRSAGVLSYGGLDSPAGAILFGYTSSGNNKYNIYISSDGSTWDIANDKNGGIPISNEWGHIVLTRSGSTFSAYKNGALTDTWTSSSAIYSSPNTPMIGRASLGPDAESTFNGTIDEVSIWNLSLEADTIKQHAQRGLTNLSIYYSVSNDSTTWTNWAQANNNTLTTLGFSITDDSLVTLADGSKKKIKDIKEGDYVQSLDEKTGKIVPRKVNALLDHGIKPIYEMTTEDGRAINTTAEHPYFVKFSNFERNKSISSSVLNTLTLDCALNAFSSDQTAQLKANANAKYCTSLLCGDNSSAESAYLLNSLKGINSTSSLMSRNTFTSSSGESLLLSTTSSRCLPTSKNKNSGDIKLKSFAILFNKNTAKALLFENNAENTLLASTTRYTKNQLFNDCLNLCANDSSTLLDNSITSFSVNLLLDTMLFNSSSLSSSCLISFLTTNAQLTLNSSISCFNSIGRGTLNSYSDISASHNGNNQNYYLKLSNDIPLGEWIEVRYLKVGDEIAVPDYSTGAIKWEKIASITYLPKQHVYDLSIEGTRNFIANDIIAHNTAKHFRYLAKFNTSNGNLTPILHDVTVNYTGIFTDSFGNYNYTLSAPSLEGIYTIKVNVTTDTGISGEALQTVTVDQTAPVVNTTFNITAPNVYDIINFTGNITDSIQLATANITYNLSGSLTKINFTLSGTTAQVSNVTKLTSGGVFNFTMYATDSASNVKQNSTLITVTDNAKPVVNTTFNITAPNVNDVINFTGNLTDETELLSANITYNISGSLTKINFTFALGTTTAQISNATKLPNGGVINFTMYVTDTSNNVKQNSTLITVTDNLVPVVNTTFNTTSPVINDIINFTGNITDETELLSANITYNLSGSLTKINFTFAVGTASAQVSNVTQITCDGGCVINFTMYATDTSNNIKQNSTLITVADRTLPIVNTTFNITSPRINDIINFSGNITDNVQLLSANITYNMSGILEKVNFTLSGTTAQVNNATKITVVRDNVINFTMYATDKYNNVKQNSTLITVANTPAPQATIVYPTSNLYINARSLQLNVTFSNDPDGDVINISYFINTTLNQTQLINTTFNASDGYYILNVSLHDNVTPLTYSANATINFTIDTINPQINFTATLSNQTFIDQNYISINITINETNLDNITYYLYNSTADSIVLWNETNFTYSNLSFNFTSLDNREKSYFINVTVRDKAGNINSTETRNITLDNKYPLVNFTSPTPANNSRAKGNSQKINISIIDVSVRSCILQVHNGSNSTNYTMEIRDKNCNVTINTLDGYNYTLQAFVNDSALHENYTSNWSFKENQAPEIPVLTAPANNSRVLTTSVTLNYTTFDNDTDAINYNVYFDTNTNPVTQVYRGTSKSFVVTATRGTTYYWKVQADDNYENSSNSTIRQFTVNTQPPIQYLKTPNLTGIKLKGSQTYNVSWVNLSDAEDNITIKLEYSTDSGATYPNTIISNKSNNGTYDWLVPSIDSSTARIKLTANDSYEFTYDESDNDFTIDSTAPVITLDNPANGSSFNNGTYINLTITDNLAAGVNATWNNNSYIGSPFRTDFNGSYDINTTGWGVGEVNITVYANDSVGNNATAFFSFNVTSVQPVVTFNNPTPNQVVRATIRVNVSSTSFLDDVPFVNFTYDGATQNFTMTQAGSDYFYDFDTTTVSDGQRKLSVYGNDSNGNRVRADIFVTIDNTRPAIRLDSPSNDSWKNASVTFVYVPNDNTTITSCSLIINNSINQTNSSISKGVENLFSNVDLGNGIFKWDANCTDQAANNNTNGTLRIIKIDTVKPAITLIDPPNESVIQANYSINFTITDTGSGRNNVTWSSNYELDSQVFIGNYAINTSTFPEGKTNITIFVNDSAGNIERILWTFTIDNTPPIVTFNKPNTRQVIRGIFRVNVTGTDQLSNVSNVTFAFNGSSNFTMSRATLPSDDYFYDWNTTNATDKEYIIKIFGNDTAIPPNVRSATRLAVVDNTAPAIRLDSPSNNSWSNTKLNTFTFAVFETNNLNNCTLLINSSINFTLTSLLKNATNTFSVNLSDGNYRWDVNCSDEAVDANGTRNIGTNSSEYLINVDAVNPQLSFISPHTDANDSHFGRNYTAINVTITETNFANITFYLYNQTVLINETNFTSITYFINFTDLKNDLYFFNATIRDKASNINSTETRQVSLNSRIPSINRLRITNSSGSTIASIDDKGDAYLMGNKTQGLTSLSPTQNSFIVQNRSGNTVFYINSTGYMFMLGYLTEDADIPVNGTNLEIRDNKDNIVATIDNKGNLRLRGLLVEKYDSP